MVRLTARAVGQAMRVRDVEGHALRLGFASIIGLGKHDPEFAHVEVQGLDDVLGDGDALASCIADTGTGCNHAARHVSPAPGL
jgi:hypothetical protein